LRNGATMRATFDIAPMECGKGAFIRIPGYERASMARPVKKYATSWPRCSRIKKKVCRLLGKGKPSNNIWNPGKRPYNTRLSQAHGGATAIFASTSSLLLGVFPLPK